MRGRLAFNRLSSRAPAALLQKGMLELARALPSQRAVSVVAEVERAQPAWAMRAAGRVVAGVATAAAG